ncbi:hypothetical protein [Oceanicola sp. 22II-s10i]|uniref:hypothetical protein n=1 Tax=Oceanicola sp. 22II-s10i TaxID=1317116 RepID=UPI0015961CCA|nr:hypothetical protein [Oceanicola sp. 22II-s10i]
MERLELKMHGEMLRWLGRLAAERDVTAGQVVRDLVAAEIRRTRDARPPVRADERLLAPLRARLADDLAHATGWADLTRRLAKKGYELRPAGGGMTMHDLRSGARLCKASELGFSYQRLMHRFGAPHPDHPHTWLAAGYRSGGPEGPPDETDPLLEDP